MVPDVDWVSSTSIHLGQTIFKKALVLLALWLAYSWHDISSISIQLLQFNPHRQNEGKLARHLLLCSRCCCTRQDHLPSASWCWSSHGRSLRSGSHQQSKSRRHNPSRKHQTGNCCMFVSPLNSVVLVVCFIYLTCPLLKATCSYAEAPPL